MTSIFANTQPPRTGLDGWHPLAFHAVQLAGADAQAAALSDLAETTRNSDDARTESTNAQIGSPVQSAAWTGDLRGPITLLDDDHFTWLRRSVGAEIWAYVASLGHAVDDVDLAAPEAWGTIVAPGQAIHPRADHGSDFTAIYHVATPSDGAAIRFLNTASGGSRTHQASAGELVVFPSRQRYEMLTNTTSEDVVTVTFRLSLHRCGDWCGCGQSDGFGADAQLFPRPVGAPRLIALDDTTLPAADADALAHAHAVLANRLTAAGFDADDSTVTLPCHSWRRDGDRSVDQISPTAIEVLVRLDDSTDLCGIEYDGDAMPTWVAQGDVVLVDARRRHRIVGPGVLLRFGAQPATMPGLDIDEAIAQACLANGGSAPGANRTPVPARS